MVWEIERATDVEEPGRGLRAAVHGEVLAVDVVRDDVVRLRISRGGVFDDPEFWKTVRPTADAYR